MHRSAAGKEFMSRTSCMLPPEMPKSGSSDGSRSHVRGHLSGTLLYRQLIIMKTLYMTESFVYPTHINHFL